MEREDKARWMRRYLESREALWVLCERLEELRRRALEVTAAGLGEPGGKPKDGLRESRIEQILVKQAALEAAAAGAVARMAKNRDEVERAVEAVCSPKLRYLLQLGYLVGMDNREMAKEMGYGVSYMARLHREALEVVEVPEEKR